MNLDRKYKFNQVLPKNKRSLSAKNVAEKPKHLLSKPKPKKQSLQKNTFQSFSTMISSNMNKSSSQKTYKLHVSKKVQENGLEKEVQKMITFLANEIKGMELLGESTIINWNQVLQELKSTLHQEKLRKIIGLIQKGYDNQRKQSQNLNKGTKNLKLQKKKSSKLSLNICKIDRTNIRDYHDEFMDKIDEFSPSWRQMLKMEKKSSC